MATDPINVAHVVQNLHIGGLERVVANLVRGLPRERYCCRVYCLEDGGPLAADLPVWVLGKSPGMSARAVGQLARQFRRDRVRIVHTHNMTAHFHGALAGLMARTARVHTKHGRDYPDSPRKVRLNHWLAKITDALVTVSDNAAGVALEIEKVDPKKVRRIWNGVDTELYRPDIRRQPPAIRPAVIGTVARLSPEKDQQTMLAAFKLVLDEWEQGRRKEPGASIRDDLCESVATPRLTFVGDGPCRAPLEAEAHRLGIAGHVDFLGARNDVAALLPGFTVFTLSSVTEGISMTVLEAMACGVPVVATDVGGNREIVQPPVCGLIVPARDPRALATAYLELLRDPARCATMGAAGRQRVLEHFSLESMVRQYSALYDELLNRKMA